MFNTLGLYVKRDGHKDFSCIATQTFEPNKPESEQRAKQLLNQEKNNWIHNGPPEYFNATYRIATYNHHQDFSHVR